MTTPNEFKAIHDLELAVWGIHLSESTPTHVMIANRHNGGNTLGYYQGDALVGFSYTLPAFDQQTQPMHYLHSIGILKEMRGHGVGTELIQHQSMLSRQKGLRQLVWTFDPLEAINARAYLHKNGAVVNAPYSPNHYGTLSGINSALPSDRIYATLWLDRSPAVKPAMTLEAIQTHYTILGYTPSTSIPEQIEGYVAIEIPEDFQAIKETDIETARQIRLHTRSVFQKVLDSGKALVDFVSIKTEEGRKNFYLSS